MAKKSHNPRLNGFSTSFILRSSYVLKNEEHPIVLKITYLGDRKEINTGLSCLAQEWLAGKGMLNPMLKKASTINWKFQPNRPHLTGVNRPLFCGAN